MSKISQLVKYSNKVYKKEFVAATDGNLSIRLDEERIAITKSGICKGDVTENDIVVVDSRGNKIEGNGNPSSELKIHLLAYNSRTDINAVVHCHPVYATAFATAGFDLTDPVFPEVILTIGPIPLCNYATPSTDGLPNSMKPYINNSWAMLLQNHGAVTFGESIQSAFNRMEKLEHAAKTIFISKLLGGETKLSSENVEMLHSIAEPTYGIKPLSKTFEQKKSKLNFESLTTSQVSFTEIIEARLRARAGNPSFSSKNSHQSSNNLNKSSKIINKLLSEFNR